MTVQTRSAESSTASRNLEALPYDELQLPPALRLLLRSPLSRYRQWRLSVEQSLPPRAHGLATPSLACVPLPLQSFSQRPPALHRPAAAPTQSLRKVLALRSPVNMPPTLVEPRRPAALSTAPATSIHSHRLHAPPRLTNNNTLFSRETVRRNFQVERSRSLPCTTRDIVVRTVARAEPAAKVSSLTNGHTTQVRADTQHDQPFWLLYAVGVGLRIAKRLPLGVFGIFNFVLGTVTDENGLSSPLDDNLEVCELEDR